ncbi:bifunctional UDP-N-acetylglucosamine diphosphorylase/glucosamine-1-phosphate N-acetyltransferase GlmU [Ottowia sp. SB7-C50]|uniref:bifunctional UDP-N-acetylglucosamine diphosphorylase/glucosamine-1-phosphate N-acetyltransferase GlmU n=1 Tax=Ottowia sp. SB7-C50 TaxID=3081231 RepID=UPI002954C56B|nr:bifunctional UDP-N-acetylglucosamine diphosphorylase/glucosamine-1-phosphate N-acetyltransferase GlmU [Ottowia sp. SB7-C50]WOP14974.1 bifunctional UDP-N-acetylglucosamine diphosphorylase/glucosamine-1-phosphate N-acetyltransferase GlmU [Ottowia sp. SB7-C50]
MSAIDVVVMAAGKGTRMKSQRPKVLHRLAGRPLLAHVLDSAAALQARSAVVVTGHGAIEVEAFCADWASAQATKGLQIALRTVRQEPQLGTGHAVQQAAPALPDDGVTLVLNGDVPLVRPGTLRRLLSLAGEHSIALLTVDTGEDAGAYGRIVRGAAEGNGDIPVRAIVEAKDASADQRAITEWYSGVIAAPTRLLKKYLALLTDDNAQKEFYLTDVVKHAVADGTPVLALQIDDDVEVAGVNSPVQLAELERALQQRHALRLMEAGVRLVDPARFDLRGTLQCGQDVEIDVGCIFEGDVTLADGVRIGAHCVIANATLAAGAVIHPFTHIDGGQDGVTVGAGALVGPFARLRPGAQLGPDVHIGNFVEVKNSTLAAGAKANHLAYLGDATVGERVNYGAGSITANYDGANKHRTVIEADVHVGSNCVLVAPLTLGAGGTVGGGSTITKSTPPGALSVARGKQISVADWQRPVKQKK